MAEETAMIPVELWEEVFRCLTFFEVVVICKQVSKEFQAIVKGFKATQCRHPSLVRLKLCRCWTKQQLGLFFAEVVRREYQPLSVRGRVSRLRRVLVQFTGQPDYPSDNHMLRLLVQKRRSLAFSNSFYFVVIVYLTQQRDVIQLRLLKILYVRFCLLRKYPTISDWKSMFMELSVPAPAITSSQW